MDVGILGPLEVRDGDGREIRLPAGRERALLALLVLHRARVVPVDRILAVLWGDRPPGSAAKAVQGYVSHLRRLLPEGTLLTRAPGYVLEIPADAVDAGRFERLAARGRALLDDDDAVAAVAALEEALAQWRGPAPLADFAYDDFAQDEIRRLGELRLGTVEDRIDALLRAGRLGGLPGELDALMAAHPLRERLRAQAMVTLYRSGRQADALTVYQEGRRLLGAELGVEPGPELQRLQRAILGQDPSLGEVPTVSTPPPAPAPAGRSRRLLRLAALAVVVVVVAVLVVVLTGGGEAVELAPPAVVVIDPASGEVVASISAGSRPIAIAGDDTAVWVGDGRDGTLTHIDPSSRQVEQTVGVGAPAVDVAVGEGGVWVATGGFGSILQVDPEAGGITRRVEPGDPADPAVPTVSSIGVGGGRVWAGTMGGVVRIDPTDGRVTGRVALGRFSALGIAVSGDTVWATNANRRAARIEGGPAEVTSEFYAGQFVVPVAIGREVVWIAGTDEGVLWQLDALTGATRMITSVGTGASAMAIGEGAVWLASWRDGAIVRVDARTGEATATIPVGGEPFDVVVAAGLVWVAVPRPVETT